MSKSELPIMRLDLTKRDLETALERTVEDAVWTRVLDNGDMFFAVRNDHAIAGLAAMFEVFLNCEQEAVDAIGTEA